MRRCIQLARNGRRNAPPNPMVGAVVVCDGRIIGEGYHVRCGEGHAEVNALASVRPEDRHLLPESTIYVSLEPCAHFGKTPPCARLIIENRLKRCVVGCIDPFAKVRGRGIEMLRHAGIEVTVGVLEKECRELNKHFFTYHSRQRPFITLKWAQTADGFIGRVGQMPDRPLVISNRFTTIECHRRRADHQAILVGRHTVETDNPALSTRHWSGPNPVPVVLGDRGKLAGGDYRLTADSRTLFFERVDDAVSGLYERGIQSLLVEGGRETLQSFIDLGLWDEAYVETADFNIGEGVAAPVLADAQPLSTRFYATHAITAYKNY